ncbi:MAG: DUF5615 family PIN-like protein [Cyanobacteriota bacterium]|nr:DUF5615 family PIN-like protein [Cyanobacteriota bacterium]
MKILLDECLPRKLKNSLEEHTVITVPQQGWSGTKNGELLRLAENEFDVFITVDRNLTYQQNLTDVNLAIVVLVARSNRLESIIPLMPEVRLALETIQAGIAIIESVRYTPIDPPKSPLKRGTLSVSGSPLFKACSGVAFNVLHRFDKCYNVVRIG